MVPQLMCLVSSVDDLALLPALAMAGVDAFQVRDKRLERDGLIALTNHVMNLVPAAKVIVNDRIDVAVITGADGVHVGASDMPVAEVRSMVSRAQGRGFLSDRFLIGATCRTAADVRAAGDLGASYVGVGPVFATTSKDGLPDPLGVEGLAAAVVPGGVPVLGIGGITPRNAVEVVAGGAHGVAVIGGIWNEPDPVAAARELVAAVRAR
ncbi:thiamine phosphate synthase [Nocardioides jiangxiensis]|uniref:Thiamine-phosphate synthase n=1 Tax=Nocardioides jiangxiensis TaxID=3064524 RepID=A0ABT9B5K0_9ACTN|nr:thiamine phosphate synthase [Nocardioides sp. WY-20]MDO7868877.1 thiamine phosphate synthase [Nocardioides sp. WY-20]